jgi:hypothetical protein
VEHQEVPEEEAADETIGVLKDRYGDRRLAVCCRGRQKEWSQGDGESGQMLAATSGRLTSRAFPAPHKGNCRQGPGRDNIARGDAREETTDAPECSNRKRDRDLKMKLRLKKKGTSGRIFRNP